MGVYDSGKKLAPDTDSDTPVKVERYLPWVFGAGLLGITASLYSLSEYFGPLQRIVEDAVKSLS